MTLRFVGGLTTTSGRMRDGMQDPRLDLRRTVESAQALEDAGFDATIHIYSSYSLDPFTIAAAIAGETERLESIVALRPNTMVPSAAAKTYATLDQLNGGRTQVHLIAGGNESDQWRDGDHLEKDERYSRMGEYIRFLRRAWSEEAAFDFAGDYYRIEDYMPKIKPAGERPLPISLGGSSAAAYRVGGALADIFAVWGEPLADMREQLRRIDEEAGSRATHGLPPLEYMISFKPIVAETDELAWEKAHRILGGLEKWKQRSRPAGEIAAHRGLPGAEASQRLLRIAEREELHDGVLWTRPAQATGAIGSSAALVGSYDRVAEALSKYVDLGFRTFSLHGYEGLEDSIEYGRELLPRLRELAG